MSIVKYDVLWLVCLQHGVPSAWMQCLFSFLFIINIYGFESVYNYILVPPSLVPHHPHASLISFFSFSWSQSSLLLNWWPITIWKIKHSVTSFNMLQMSRCEWNVSIFSKINKTLFIRCRLSAFLSDTTIKWPPISEQANNGRTFS